MIMNPYSIYKCPEVDHGLMGQANSACRAPIMDSVLFNEKIQSYYDTLALPLALQSEE